MKNRALWGLVPLALLGASAPEPAENTAVQCSAANQALPIEDTVSNEKLSKLLAELDKYGQLGPTIRCRIDAGARMGELGRKVRTDPKIKAPQMCVLDCPVGELCGLVAHRVEGELACASGIKEKNQRLMDRDVNAKSLAEKQQRLDDLARGHDKYQAEKTRLSLSAAGTKAELNAAEDAAEKTIADVDRAMKTFWGDLRKSKANDASERMAKASKIYGDAASKLQALEQQRRRNTEALATFAKDLGALEQDRKKRIELALALAPLVQELKKKAESLERAIVELDAAEVRCREEEKEGVEKEARVVARFQHLLETKARIAGPAKPDARLKIDNPQNVRSAVFQKLAAYRDTASTTAGLRAPQAPIRSDGIMVLIYGADWCEACKALAQDLEGLIKEYSDALRICITIEGFGAYDSGWIERVHEKAPQYMVTNCLISEESAKLRDVLKFEHLPMTLISTPRIASAVSGREKEAISAIVAEYYVHDACASEDDDVLTSR